jgi:hypothetical protein
VAYEKNFWATKMHLAGCSSEDLSASKTGYDNFLASEANLAAVREALAAEGVSPEQRHVLGIMEKTFSTYITEDPRAAQYKEKLNQLEAELAQSRNAMALGYTDPQVGTGRGVVVVSWEFGDRCSWWAMAGATSTAVLWGHAPHCLLPCPALPCPPLAPAGPHAGCVPQGQLGAASQPDAHQRR